MASSEIASSPTALRNDTDLPVFRHASSRYRDLALGRDTAVWHGIASLRSLYDSSTVPRISAKLGKRRELIGDFEVNGVFSYQSLPFDQVESSMQLFAKEVGPEIKSWQRQDRRQPVAVASAVSAATAK